MDFPTLSWGFLCFALWQAFVFLWIFMHNVVSFRMVDFCFRASGLVRIALGLNEG